MTKVSPWVCREKCREYQVQLLCLLPERAGINLDLLYGRCDHPQPVLRFTRFSLAYTDAITKLLLGARVVRLAVICPHTRARADELGNQRLRNQVDRNTFGELNDCLAKLCGALLKIIHLRRRCVTPFGIRHLNFVIPSSFRFRHSTFLRYSDLLRCSFSEIVAVGQGQDRAD
jgi:hypothetical protein